MLAKRLDPSQSLTGRRQLPIREELVPVLRCPLDRETERSRGKPTVEDLEASDGDLDLEFAVHSVEVRRMVIVEVHADDDPEESRDLRHCLDRTG
jgi:hypothetical protein